MTEIPEDTARVKIYMLQKKTEYIFGVNENINRDCRTVESAIAYIKQEITKQLPELFDIAVSESLVSCME